jgi:aryl-alcohol dehydrogenase-like predicted oxidoreductase
MTAQAAAMTPLHLTGIDRPLAPFVLGTMTFGDNTDARAAAVMVEDFLAAGGTGIDTANGYAVGRSEEILADLLVGRRDQVVLATKVGIPHPDAAGAAPLSIDGTHRCVIGSLRRLRVDHVDLLYLHQPDRTTLISQTLTAIRILLDTGVIAAWGVSNYAAWQIAQLRQAATECAVPDPVIAQQVYNIVATRLDDEYAEYARTTGLPTVVYNPLAGGLLTGKHTPRESLQDGRFGDSRLGTMNRERYWNLTVFDAVTALRGLADHAGLPMAEIALRWTIDRPAVDAVLIGGSQPRNLRTNLAGLARGPLPGDLAAAVTAISEQVRGPMPPYNR